MRRVAGRYEADLATAYIHSVRRMLYQDEWKPVEYSFGTPERAAGGTPIVVHRELPGGPCFTPELVSEILEAAELKHMSLADTKAAVVGAAGNIGSVLAAVLSGHVGRLKLIGRNGDNGDGLKRLRKTRLQCLCERFDFPMVVGFQCATKGGEHVRWPSRQ